MKVLLIKTSSMGDLIHTLPALTDATIAIPGIQFDWVVEEPFAEIPHWHPAVNNIIPVALRRWRKGFFSRQTLQEWRERRKQLNENHYDIVLDAQGLVKSALLTWFTKGKRVGLDFRSAREALASFAYQKKCTVNFEQHAVDRMRQLFSQALDYPMPTTPPDFGLSREAFSTGKSDTPYVVFLHSTTWDSKQWPETYWCQLADLAEKSGYRVKISGGNQEELARAARIGTHSKAVDTLPRLTIGEMGALLANSKGAIAVDTGFGHLASALNLPTVSIYGSTNPEYTGAVGSASKHLAAEFACAPCLNRTCTFRKPSDVKPACYKTVPPQKVWDALVGLIPQTVTFTGGQ